MVARVMLKDGYESEIGLGWNNDGTTRLLKFVENYGGLVWVTSLQVLKRGGFPWKGKKLSSFTRARTTGGEGPYLC